MFNPSQNPGYETLANDATSLITDWVRNEWYESSAEDKPANRLAEDPI